MKIYHMVFLISAVIVLSYLVFKEHSRLADTCDNVGGTLIYMDGKYRCFSAGCVVK